VVGLHVRVDHVSETQIVAPGDVEILDDVQLRVYDRALSFSLSAEDIGRATGFRPQNLSEDHDVFLPIQCISLASVRGLST
jgi:hypothetical protein